MQNKSKKKGSFTKKEKDILLKVSKEIAKEKKIVGVAAYGSQVANYATEDSDYDIIIVLENYRSRVKYRYIKKEFEISALIVDKDWLIRDAEKASLGEFVAGRLLNIYLPLRGKKYFKEVENKIKKRVVLEALQEIETSIGEFVKELKIPVEYFLYDKLKKRASIYPPVLYSYSKTYGEELRAENTEAACQGFIEAIKILESEGLVTLEGKILRVKDIGSKRWMAMLSEIIKYTTRGLTQYAVHGYAGTIGLNIISKEVMSKISREKKGYEVPEMIKNPRNLWEIDEGQLVVGDEEWLKKVLDNFKLKGDLETKKEHIGEVYSVSKVYSISNKDSEVKFIVKKFSDLKAVKWVVLNIWSLMSKRFDMNPLSRLYNEYTSLKKLRQIGLNTPKVLVVALDKRILVTEFIEGKNMGNIISKVLNGENEMQKFIKLYGEELGKVHNSGYTLGDTKPSNSILAKDKIFLVDLEQTGKNGDTGWDIAEFIYYSSKLTLNSDAAKKLVNEFLDGYLKYRKIDSVKEALKLKYLAPFQPILAPNVVNSVREEIKKRI